MGTKTKHAPGRIVAQTEGYFLDRAGSWWIINPQRGWVRVDSVESRALRHAIWRLTQSAALAKAEVQS